MSATVAAKQKANVNNQSRENRMLCVATKLGWVGLLSDGSQVLQLKMGYTNQDELLSVCSDWQAALSRPNDLEKKWLVAIRQYASGEQLDLQSLPVRIPQGTTFQQRVRQVVRSIPAGEVMTYGEVARRAGFPKAARAVGTVMSRNQLPLLIPCHRVIGTGGLGGFSAPSGICLKQQLLVLEGNVK